jgi:EAL domain-containing protein (putative c-di-GMP-specific phosphodiesterase class I)
MIPYFQPIIDTWTNTIIGYEAMIRGKQGETAPRLFEEAIRSHTIVPFDNLARRLSIEQGIPLLLPGEKLFLNIATQTFLSREPWFPPAAPMNQMVLEISEQFPIDLRQVQVHLKRLKQEGLEIAIDDFGRGFTNLDLIASLPLSYIKLDKMFSAAMDQEKMANVIKHMVRLCQDNQTRLIVEGVETPRQQSRLMDLGVRYMQGFHLGYPQPAHYYIQMTNLEKKSSASI